MTENAEFLPFHAINEFMRPDFRLKVIRETLTSQTSIPEHYINELNHQIKKKVTIPGFRNSDKAPALIKVLPTSKAFEKYPEIVSAILSCWAEYQSELRTQIYQLLSNQNWNMVQDISDVTMENLSPELIKEWPVLPVSINRAKLPGFSTHWPKDQNFETLYTKYTELFPDSDASIDTVSLMVVWLSMRLPYKFDTPNIETTEPLR